jgi:hypothetical protein
MGSCNGDNGWYMQVGETINVLSCWTKCICERTAFESFISTKVNAAVTHTPPYVWYLYQRRLWYNLGVFLLATCCPDVQHSLCTLTPSPMAVMVALLSTTSVRSPLDLHVLVLEGVLTCRRYHAHHNSGSRSTWMAWQETIRDDFLRRTQKMTVESPHSLCSIECFEN